MLAIGAPIAMPALTGMRGTHVAALAAMLTQPGHGGVAVVGSNLAAHHLHITKLACPAGGTGAHIAGSVLYAGPALLTRAAGTPVHHLVTVRASEPGLAEALVGAVDAFTCSIVFARAAVAGVYPALAVGAREALLAEAGIVIDPVLAETTVHAGAQRAVLVIGLAVNAAETQWAGAGEGVDIVRTCGSVLTGVGAALVLVLLAVLPDETGHAKALVVSCLV